MKSVSDSTPAQPQSQSCSHPLPCPSPASTDPGPQRENTSVSGERGSQLLSESLWLMQLWRLRSLTMRAGCKLEAQEGQWCNQKARGPGAPMPEVRRRQISQLKQAGKILPFSAFLFYALNGLGDAHPHWGGSSSLLSLSRKCSSLPETTSQTHPRMMLTSYLGIAQPSRVDTKINHHSGQGSSGPHDGHSLLAIPHSIR